MVRGAQRRCSDRGRFRDNQLRSLVGKVVSMILPVRTIRLIAAANANTVRSRVRTLFASRPWPLTASSESTRPYWGYVSCDILAFQKQSPWANAFSPKAIGRLRAHDSSTMVDLTIRPKGLTAVFVAFFVLAGFWGGAMMLISANWRRSAPLYVGVAPIAMAIGAYALWLVYFSRAAKNLENGFVRRWIELFGTENQMTETLSR
jgi:hypothetical protein